MKQLPKFFRFFFSFPKFIYSSVVFSSCLAVQNALAGAPLLITPTAPGVSVSTALGNLVNGWADVLAPLVGTPTGFMFLDPQGLFHDSDEYTTSLGGGFRVLTQQAGILGAYVFGDYNQFDNGTQFWFVSPGIERLGDSVDFSFNLYVPVSSQRVNTGAGFASDFGNFQFVQFSGHTEMDEIVNTFNSTGLGYDGEIGYRLPFLPNNTKLYLGGYHFSPKDNNSITGGTARLEAPVSNFVSISASDAYDNIFHNTFKVGISVSLWGRDTHYSNHDVATRMVDPIQRNRVAVEGRATTSQYIAKGQENTGELAVAMSNIWFFAPGGTFVTTPTLNDCTYQNPCSSNDVNSGFFGDINNLQANANMFLAPGAYDNINGSLVVDRGQSMYGRTADYIYPARGNTRPLLTGSLDLFGANTIDSLRWANDPSNIQMEGVLIEDNAHWILLNNVLIGNQGGDPAAAYQTGMKIGNNSGVTVFNSEIDAFSNVSSVDATGVQVNGSQNQLNVTSSTVSATTNAADAVAVGLADMGDRNNWMISLDKISAVSLMSNSGFTADIDTTGTNNLWQIRNSSLTATSPDIAAGINSQNGANNIWMINSDQMNISSTIQTYGIFENQGNHDSWKLSGDTVNVTGLEDVFGIQDLNGDTNTWQLNSNQIQVSSAPTGFSNLDFGIENMGGQSNSWNLNNNTISVSNSTLDSDSTGILDSHSNSDSWTLKQNTIFTLSSGSVSPSTGIEDVLGVDNSWQLQNNRITTITTSNGANSILTAFTTNDIWNLTGNQLTGNGIAHAFIVEDIGGSNDSWNLVNNQISATATGDGGEAIGVQDLFSNNNTWNLTGNQISATVTGGSAFAEAVNTFGSSNDVWNVTNNIIIAKAMQADSWALGIYDHGSNGAVWTMTGNHISASAAGNSSFAVGVALASDNANFNMSSNQISATTSGDFSDAIGVSITGTSNSVSSTGDSVIANTTGTGSNAYGFTGDGPFDPTGAHLTTVQITNDQIQVTSAQSNAYGIYDPFDIVNGNTWSVTGTTIQATAPGQACKFFLQSLGGCVN